MHSETILNIKEALQRASGDEQLLEELFDILFKQSYIQLDVLEKAWIEKDSDSIRRTAHCIKGAAGSLGAIPLMNAASVLENIGINNKLTEFKTAKEILLHRFQELQNHITSGEWKK